ncbi:MAG TPA: flagellar hook protein FlgE [Steroidobacteraceae bacterium]|jgi:flagellar hook protein FlgE
MSFDLALSGLNAATADLNVTSNNIANVATTGFKESRAEFADIYAQSQTGVSKIAVGNGVRVASVSQQFSQGNVTATQNNLDLGLNGSGFFIVSDNGALKYTRAGAFEVDNNGNIINSSGEHLQGYAPLSTGGFNTGGLADIKLTTAENPPQATQNATLTLNLPSSATAPTTAPFDPTNPATYTDTTSLTTYDSLGAAHTAQLYFIKGATANTWSSQLYVDGNAVGTPQALTYSGATGALTVPAGGKLTFPAYTPATGAAAMNLTFDFSGTTQFGDQFTVNAVQQDGFTTGRLIGIDIDPTGVVEARFTNGKATPLGQVALANFENPQGLQQVGNTEWAETFGSGQAVRGTAGSSGFGTMQSGALESSNVDITSQLVNMITAQRDFQANAQVISTTDQITQTIINMRQ